MARTVRLSKLILLASPQTWVKSIAYSSFLQIKFLRALIVAKFAPGKYHRTLSVIYINQNRFQNHARPCSLSMDTTIYATRTS